LKPTLKELYESSVLHARSLLETDLGIRALFDPEIEPVLLERFLIMYNASGVYMTEPVEGWIRRAGERCVEIGLTDIGRSLIMHARHEADHHLMLIADTRHLVAGWNARHRPPLNADHLLAAPPLRATRDYIKLHEDTIAGDMPFGQIAIEFEIERISVTLFTRLVERWKCVLGPEIMRGLSFLEEHVELDVGHTQLNEKIMERLLGLRPEAAASLGKVGAAALEIYVAFMNECLATTRDALNREAAAAA
jgi:hypothetical protein